MIASCSSIVRGVLHHIACCLMSAFDALSLPLFSPRSNVTEEFLLTECDKFGEVDHVAVPEGSGIGLVRFQRLSDAAAALSAFHCKNLMGSEVRPWTWSRLRGASILGY